MERRVIEEGDGYEIWVEGPRWVYSVRLPKITPKGMKLLNEVKEAAITRPEINTESLTREQRKMQVTEVILRLLKEKETETGIYLDSKYKALFAELITNDMIGYGMLEPLLGDDEIEEIMVIGPDQPVYIFHRKYGMCETNVVFENPLEITHIIDRIASSVGRRVDMTSPLLDARLRDGSRVNATLSPPGLDGPTLTIRKFKKDPLTIVDLMRSNTLNPEVGAFLWLMVDGLGAKPGNLLIAGGTGSGKTTTLNALAIFVRERERLITIEDTAELQLPVRHVVRYEARPPSVEGRGELSMDALLKNTLRMRPDRIIVGEVRGPEAMTMFTAMNTGHDGSMGTLHANSSREVITRLTNEPMKVPIIMIPALDLIIMQHRSTHKELGPVRRIMEISEVSGVREDQVAMNKIYEYDPKADMLQPTGVPSVKVMELADHTGISMEEINTETERRRIVLEYLLKKDIHKIGQVRSWVEDYYLDPETTLKRIEEGLLAGNGIEPEVVEHGD
jgi:flagellar protein FlaI